MRSSQRVMESNHEKIVRGAARLLRERGLGTSLADVMQAAGMTQGGFYRHFRDKDELTAQAVASAFDDFVAPLEAGGQGPDAKAALARFVDLYLSNRHRAHPGVGCPVAALGGELARAPQSVRGAFSTGVRRVIAALANGRDGSSERRHREATREFAMLVGAMVIARSGDPALADQVLDACRPAPAATGPRARA